MKLLIEYTVRDKSGKTTQLMGRFNSKRHFHQCIMVVEAQNKGWTSVKIDRCFEEQEASSG